MQLIALKTYFQNALLGYYPNPELQSFFNFLCEDYLGYKRIDVSLNAETLIEGSKYALFQNAIERLKQYEPIQYVLGATEFYGIEFKVNSSVLIPRPETEELVNWIINNSKSKGNINILDIGTGSGCIAISLAKHLTNANVYALDVSKKALEVAKFNAVNNQIDVNFIEADILNVDPGFLISKVGEFDVIVSNPPYVRELEKSMMKPNVLKHEPHLALFVEDTDALLFYRKIVEHSKALLKPFGSLYFEINEYLGEETKSLFKKANFIDIELKQDLFLKDRMIKGIKG